MSKEVITELNNKIEEKLMKLINYKIKFKKRIRLLMN